MHQVLAKKLPIGTDERRLEKAALLLCEFAGAEAVRRSMDAVRDQDRRAKEEAEAVMDAINALHETVTGQPMFVA